MIRNVTITEQKALPLFRSMILINIMTNCALMEYQNHAIDSDFRSPNIHNKLKTAYNFLEDARNHVKANFLKVDPTVEEEVEWETVIIHEIMQLLIKLDHVNLEALLLNLRAAIVDAKTIKEATGDRIMNNSEEAKHITTRNLYDNLSNFHQVYPEGKPENPVPDNTHCFVYCSNGNDVEGFSLIRNLGDLGFHALIAQNWITVENLLLIMPNREKVTGIELVAEALQINLENGKTPEHDFSEYGDNNDLILAAISYATPPEERVYDLISANGLYDKRRQFKCPSTWPWMEEFWKPSPDDRIKELTKAAVLLIHQIDLLKYREEQK